MRATPETTVVEMRSVVLFEIHAGRIGIENVDKVFRPLSNYLENVQMYRLVVDLCGVTYMTAAGIKILVDAAKTAREMGGDVRLVVPSSATRLKDTLVTTGIDTVIKSYETQAEAVGSY